MKRTKRGFTLIELVITLAVLAILVAWGFPSLQESIKNNRMAAQNNEMIAILKYARTEAIRRNTDVRVVITALDDGWRAYVEDPDAAENLEGCEVGELRCTDNDKVALSASETLTFNNRGYIRDETDATWVDSTLYLQHDDCRGQNQRRLIHIAPTGQVSSCALPCGDLSASCPG
jgi:type IV fimbrial biogenesis protein FimT